MAPMLANLGLAPEPGDDDRRRQLRGDLVRALGTVANDPEIQQESGRALAAGRRDPELVDAALLAAAVDVVAANGDEADFDDFLEAWRSAPTPQEEMRYLYALADFPRPELVARLYDLVLTGEIRSQNAPLLLRHALANRDCGRETWGFIAGNWDRLNELFASSLVVRMLEGITHLNTAADSEEVEAFFQTHDVPSGERTLQQILEKQRVQVALREREADRLTHFLVG